MNFHTIRESRFPMYKIHTQIQRLKITIIIRNAINPINVNGACFMRKSSTQLQRVNIDHFEKPDAQKEKIQN